MSATFGPQDESQQAKSGLPIPDGSVRPSAMPDARQGHNGANGDSQGGPLPGAAEERAQSGSEGFGFDSQLETPSGLFSRVTATPTSQGLAPFPLASWHLEKFPFRAPSNAHECVAWYEGSFNPIHEGHAHIILRALEMNFRTVVVGTVPKNPHKDPATFFPFEIRVECVREQLREMGIPVANSSREPGVFVTDSEESFHDERLRAWYRDDRYIIMGPDNFQAYYAENRAWALFAAGDTEMRDFSRFQRLYHSLLKERILVNDEEYAHHSSDVRNGQAKILPSVLRVLKSERSLSLIKNEGLLRLIDKLAASGD